MHTSNFFNWVQRRRLLSELKNSVARLEAIESKMISGQPLTSEEQDTYDVIGREVLLEKVTCELARDLSLPPNKKSGICFK